MDTSGFQPVHSAGITDENIRRQFLNAKYPRRRCDGCGSVNVYHTDESHHQWRCRDCWRYTLPDRRDGPVGTRRSLRFWYEGLWQFVLSHSAHQAHKLLKTDDTMAVWHVYQTIRTALKARSEATWEKESGTDEVDEALYGGRWRNLRQHIKRRLREQSQNRRGRGAKVRKQPVFGILQRNGTVYLRLIDTFEADELEPIIQTLVREDSTVMSDTWKAGWATSTGASSTGRANTPGARCTSTGSRASGTSPKPTCTPTRASGSTTGSFT